MLIITTGLPGVGKTEVAKRLAPLIGAEHIQTDAVRKELFPQPTYSAAEKQRVYTECFRRAELHLRAGKHVIFDGSFLTRISRDEARKFAKRQGVEFKLIYVYRPTREVMGDIGYRKQGGKTLSDADAGIHVKAIASFEEPRGNEPHIRIDNVKSRGVTREKLEGMLRERFKPYLAR